MRKGITFIVLSTLIMTGSMVNAELLVNGDFEDTTGWGDWTDTISAAPADWRYTASGTYDENPAVQQTGVNAIGGSGTSALLESTDAGGLMSQQLTTESGPVFTFSFDFASEAQGTGGSRTLPFTLYRTSGTLPTLGAPTLVGRIAEGTTGGNLEFYNGNAWQVALADAVIWDDDVTTTPQTHHLTLDWVASDDVVDPYIDVEIIDSNGIAHSATGLTTMWRDYDRDVVPVSSQSLSTVEFRRNDVSALALIDNASVIPEPATISIFMAAIAGIAFYRRRFVR